MNEKRTTLKRPKVETRQILLRAPQQAEHAKSLISNLPVDPEHPIEILIREQVKKRKLSTNAAMWAGPLRDIERDGWYQGSQYAAEVWHEHFKELFLPDENDPDFDPSHVVEGYRKWGYNPWKDTRALVGSTTQLTDSGMRLYLLKMEAEAATEHGVTFGARIEDIEPIGRIV
ncbi:MAG: recombination protein NinB [Bryobacteraceae bacterium]